MLISTYIQHAMEIKRSRYKLRASYLLYHLALSLKYYVRLESKNRVDLWSSLILFILWLLKRWLLLIIPNYVNNVACKMFYHFIAQSKCQLLMDELTKVNYFSLLLGESTDCI